MFTENNNNQKSNVLTLSGSLFCAFVFILLAVVVICKRRSGKMERRGKVMKTEENADYGIYDDGPVYNVVTDENAYYGS